MKSTYTRVSLVILTLALNACGADTTAFKDIAASRYAVVVDPNASSSGDATHPIDDADPMSSTTHEDSGSSDAEKMGEGKGNSKKEKGDDKETDDKQTLSECSRHFRGKARKLTILSSGSVNDKLVLDADTVIGVRLSGNKQKFELNVSGVERLAGVCILATGNQPKVSIVSDVDLGFLVYMGRGNQSQGSIVLSNNHKLETSFIELKGNGNTLSLTGVASTHCDNAVLKGNASNAVKCSAPTAVQ
jgi:hypothetical protein